MPDDLALPLLLRPVALRCSVLLCCATRSSYGLPHRAALLLCRIAPPPACRLPSHRRVQRYHTVPRLTRRPAAAHAPSCYPTPPNPPPSAPAGLLASPPPTSRVLLARRPPKLISGGGPVLPHRHSSTPAAEGHLRCRRPSCRTGAPPCPMVQPCLPRDAREKGGEGKIFCH